MFASFSKKKKKKRKKDVGEWGECLLHFSEKEENFNGEKHPGGGYVNWNIPH